VKMLDNAQLCIHLSQEALLEGDNARSIQLALEAAKYLQLIRLLRTELSPVELRKAAE